MEGGGDYHDEPSQRYSGTTINEAMSLFVNQTFVSHSGKVLDFKIDCDALTDADLATLASVIAKRFKFGAVEGVPRGGLRLAEALQPYVTKGPALIVDDVLTTGASMEQARKALTDRGVVIFARGPCPSWITPIFKLDGEFWEEQPPSDGITECGRLDVAAALALKMKQEGSVVVSETLHISVDSLLAMIDGSYAFNRKVLRSLGFKQIGVGRYIKRGR